MVQAEKYLFSEKYGVLYEWDSDQNAYIFVSSTEHKTKHEAVREYEELTFNQGEEWKKKRTVRP